MGTKFWMRHTASSCIWIWWNEWIFQCFRDEYTEAKLRNKRKVASLGKNDTVISDKMTAIIVLDKKPSMKMDYSFTAKSKLESDDSSKKDIMCCIGAKRLTMSRHNNVYQQ